MRQTPWLIPALVLSGCFLDQQKPPPQHPVKGPIIGVVALEDMKGPQSAAVFVALFAKKAAAGAVRSRVGGERGCQVNRKPKTVATRAVSPLSVGRLTFGQALQSTHVEVPEGKDHRYLMSIPTEFPPGIYQISAQGNADAPAFSDYLQVPELLEDPAAADQAFGSSAVLVRKSEDLVVTWRPAKVPNADAVMVLDVETETDTERITLHCLSRERDVPVVDGVHRWVVARAGVAELPDTRDALIYLVRALGRESAGKGVELTLQGLRTYYTPAEVAP